MLYNPKQLIISSYYKISVVLSLYIFIHLYIFSIFFLFLQLLYMDMGLQIYTFKY